MVKKDCRLWRPPSLKSCLIYECSILFDILLPKIGPYPVVTAMQYKNIKNNKQKKMYLHSAKIFSSYCCWVYTFGFKYTESSCIHSPFISSMSRTERELDYGDKVGKHHYSWIFQRGSSCQVRRKGQQGKLKLVWTSCQVKRKGEKVELQWMWAPINKKMKG